MKIVRRLKWPAVLMICALLFVTTVTPAVAARSPSDVELPWKLLSSYTTPKAMVAESFIGLAQFSPELEQFQRRLSFAHDGQFLVEAVRAQAVKADGLIGVLMPVHGGESRSAFQLWFDPETREVVASMAFLFRSTSEGWIDALVEVDGVQRVSALIDLDGQLLSGTLFDELGTPVAPLEAMPTQSVTWNCMSSCLSSLGIEAWVLALAGIICGAVCLGTVGLGCVACLGAGALGIGHAAGYCYDQCS